MSSKRTTLVLLSLFLMSMAVATVTQGAPDQASEAGEGPNMPLYMVGDSALTPYLEAAVFLASIRCGPMRWPISNSPARMRRLAWQTG